MHKTQALKANNKLKEKTGILKADKNQTENFLQVLKEVIHANLINS